MGNSALSHMATLKMDPPRAMFLASVLLLFYATCVSAEVSQNLVVEEVGPPIKPCPAGSFFWGQCISEGGSKDCAKCKGVGNGVLPCDMVKDKGGHHPYNTCPDNKLWKGSVFMAEFAWGDCQALTLPAALGGFAITTYLFPGGICDSSAPRHPRLLGKNLVATKALVAHPNRADANVGVVMMKRVVTHRCTGIKPAFCKKGVEVADVFKQGFCVKCKSKKYTRADCGNSCTVFSKTKAQYATDEERTAFINECVKEAFTSEGVMKDDYQCSGEDLMRASASIKAF